MRNCGSIGSGCTLLMRCCARSRSASTSSASTAFALSPPRRWHHLLNMLTALLVICVLSCVGFATKATGSSAGILNQVSQLLGFNTVPLPAGGSASAQPLVVYSALLVIGVVSLFIAFLPISALFHVRSNPKAFAVRLWRIVVGVAIM